jgi:hypothetical protein
MIEPTAQYGPLTEEQNADSIEAYLRQPVAIPVVQGPFRPYDAKTASYGRLRIVEGDHKEYERARDYIAYGPDAEHPGDPTLRSVFMFLETGTMPNCRNSAPTTTDLHLNADSPRNAFLGKPLIDAEHPELGYKNDMFCSPRHALSTADGNGISSALITAHEATHAYHYAHHPNAFELRCASPLAGYSDLEEYQTIQRERHAARALGEGLRSIHVSLDIPVLKIKIAYPVNDVTDRYNPYKYPTRIMKMSELLRMDDGQDRTEKHLELAEDPRLTAYVQRQKEQHRILSGGPTWRSMLSLFPLGPGNAAALVHDALLRATGLDQWLRSRTQLAFRKPRP